MFTSTVTAIDEKDIQSASSIYYSHLQYLYKTISTNILNQTKENKTNPTRRLKRDSHTLKHLKAGARPQLRSNEMEEKVVVGQAGQMQMGVLLSRHPIELSKAKF